MKTDQEINVAIAEACGWEISEDLTQYKKPGAKQWTGRGYDPICECIPNYCADLNAMHEAENSLTIEKTFDYAATLCDMLNVPDFDPEFCVVQWPAINATARQRAEAFLRTLGKWEDE